VFPGVDGDQDGPGGGGDVPLLPGTGADVHGLPEAGGASTPSRWRDAFGGGLGGGGRGGTGGDGGGRAGRAGGVDRTWMGTPI